jgi:hypothetical protein
MKAGFRARTSSGVRRIRTVLTIKLLHNREVYNLTVRLEDGSETKLEAIPRTINEREFHAIVPGVTKITLLWDNLVAIEPLSDDDENETTDPLHPFSAEDLPFDS